MKDAGHKARWALMILALGCALLMILFGGCSNAHVPPRPETQTDAPQVHLPLPNLAGTRWRDPNVFSDPHTPITINSSGVLQFIAPYGVHTGADTGLYRYRRGYAVFESVVGVSADSTDSMVVTPGLVGAWWLGTYDADTTRTGTVRLVFAERTPVWRQDVYDESLATFVGVYDTLPAWRVYPPEIVGAEADRYPRTLTQVP